MKTFLKSSSRLKNHYTETTEALLRHTSPSRINKLKLLTVLDESNLLGVAAEALPAAHEPVLADQTVGVSTHAAGAGSRAVALRVRVPDVGVAHDCKSLRERRSPS